MRKTMLSIHFVVVSVVLQSFVAVSSTQVNSINCTTIAPYDWTSPDCPVNAVCVPSSCGHSHAPRYCTCTFSDGSFRQSQSGTSCEATPMTRLYAVFWIVAAVASICVCLHMVQTLWISHKHHVLKLDIMTVSCISNLTSACFQALTVCINPILLLANLTKHAYNAWKILHLVFNAIYASFVLVTVLTFGVATYSIVVQSAQMHSVNGDELFRMTMITAFGFAVMMFLGGLLLFYYGFTAMTYGFFAVFAVCVWFLFRMIVKQGAELVNESTEMRRRSSASVGGTAVAILTSNTNPNPTPPMATRHNTNNTNKETNTNTENEISIAAMLSTTSLNGATNTNNTNTNLTTNVNTITNASNRLAISTYVHTSLHASQEMLAAAATFTNSAHRQSLVNTITSALPLIHHRASQPQHPVIALSTLILTEMHHLARQFSPLAFLFPCTAATFNLVWYIGLATCNQEMIGPGIACLYAFSYTLITLAMFFVGLFMRHLAEIRISHQQAHPHPHSPQHQHHTNRKTSATQQPQQRNRPSI